MLIKSPDSICLLKIEDTASLQKFFCQFLNEGKVYRARSFMLTKVIFLYVLTYS